MNRDVNVPAIILSPKSPRLERIFWRAQIGTLVGHFGFLAKIDANHSQPPRKSPWLETIFWRAQTGTLEGPFGFLAKIDANHAKIKAKIVWIVIYACPRSFWAQNRRDWRQFFDGPKLAPWRALLGFWAKTMQIMPKARVILYEAWSTRGAIILGPNSPRLETIFWRAQICTLERPFGVLAKNNANHAQIKANIVWIVIYACPRSFWAQNRRDWRQFFDGSKLAPRRAILGFWLINK